MKEIFIGSSKEGLEQATQVAAVLSEAGNVKPLLWTEYFKPGEITFLGIENIASRVAGAVFLATPDDDSVIRERRIKTPRGNVLFEYGYLSATLTRSRVALCHYTGAELPSDFAGVTYISMGPLEPTKPLNDKARERLKSWVTELPAIHAGFSPTCQMHGYSGRWQVEVTYEVYRHIQIKDPDYVFFNGNMILQIPADGNGGAGSAYGNLQIQIGDCYAEFEASDRVIDAKVFGDGSMKIRNAIQSLQRIKLEGVPPQRDGFEPEFRGARGPTCFFTVLLTSLASSVRISQVISEATFTRRRRESGTDRFQINYRRNASHFGRSTLYCNRKRFRNRKGNMKTKLSAVALFASAFTIAQANPGGIPAAKGTVHRGAVARSAPAVHAPMRPGGVSSFHSMPMRSHGSRPFYSGQRSPSFGMRSSPSSAYRRPFYSSRGSVTRSGPYTVATIPQRNRVAPFANRRNSAVTHVWNQRNIGTQFRNGNDHFRNQNNLRNANDFRNAHNFRNSNNFRNGNNLRNTNNFRNGKNHLRRDWQRHVFAHRSGDWHRDWNRNCDHWVNGHRCSFINGSWVIFNLGFSPWWPSYYPDNEYYGNDIPYYGSSSPYFSYDDPYSYNYDPNYYDSGDYEGQMYYDQNSYPDQSQGYYDSGVYQTEAYDDPNDYSQESQSDYSTIVAAQERLAHQGYYRGETDGVLSPETQKALRRYQNTNGLRQTGDLDSDTLTVMGLSKGTSY